jgi:predicted permease
VITSIVFGLVPALQATGLDLVSAFKGGGTVGRRLVRPSRIRSFVVGVQVAGSGLLLVVAALFIRAATRAASADPGFATETTVAFGLNVEQPGYTPSRTRVVYESLRERLASAPGVQSVALVSPLPLLGRRSSTVAVDSGTAARDRMDDVNMASVSGSFFGTMQIAIVSGRAFTDAEARTSGGGNEPVVVSRSFANAFWPASSPIGKRLRVADPNGPASHVVVGVAADTRYTTLAGESPFIYLPAFPERDGRLSLMARVSNPTLLPQVERSVPLWARELDGSLVVTAERMSERVALELKPPRLASAVAGTMGALALLLAIVGIYGVVSYAVSQRTRDIAVRLALGASRGGVVRLMMREGSRPVAFGLGVGLALAFAVSRVIRGLLFGMSGLDPVVYAGMAVLLVAASLTAMYAPARRAARVDPALTLREE